MPDNGLARVETDKPDKKRPAEHTLDAAHYQAGGAEDKKLKEGSTAAAQDTVDKQLPRLTLTHDGDSKPATTATGSTTTDANSKKPPGGEVDFDELRQDLGSDASKFRTRLQSDGVDVSKPTTRIDLYEPHYDAAPDHADKVKEVITDAKFGLSPGADVQTEQKPEKSRDLKLSDYPTLGDFAAAHSTQTIQDMTNFIKDKYLSPTADNDRHVLNISQEHSQLTTAGFMTEQMRANPDKYSQYIKDVLSEKSTANGIETVDSTKADRWIADAKALNSAAGKPNATAPDGTQSGAELDVTMKSALLPIVDQSVADSKDVKKAIQEYQEVTKKAAEHGVVIVVAAGNHEDPSGAHFNYYAQSDTVISVGGGGSSQNAEQTTHDLWHMSPTGNGKYNPTLIAQADGVPSSIDDSPVGKAGTSFAAPLVSATVANILTRDDKISFDDVKFRLQGASRRIPDVPESKQGAGALDVERAILGQ